MNERNIIETQPERTDLPLIVIPVIVESMIEPFAANFPLLHDIARIRMHCDFTLDTDTILESVEKTGRLIVVDESHPRCSMASDIAGLVAENAFDSLKAPIRQITGPHSPVPFSDSLEELYIPSAAKIVAAPSPSRSTADVRHPHPHDAEMGPVDAGGQS